MTIEPARPDYARIAEGLKKRRIVPFFGAGASASGLDSGLPTGRDLMKLLVKASDFPPDSQGIKRSDDLAFVASYLALKDSQELDSQVRTALTSVKATPGRLHTVLAKPDEVRFYLTTNYDNLIELALEPRKPWVVVNRAIESWEDVWCRPPGGPWNKYASKTLGAEPSTEDIKKGPVVIKLHGTLDPDEDSNDSFLITQEQYLSFLGRPPGGDPGGQIPPSLFALMRKSSFLFLGYALKDWNIRLLLQQFAKAQETSPRHWAIVLGASDAEISLWKSHNVDVFNVDLKEFADHLDDALKASS